MQSLTVADFYLFSMQLTQLVYVSSYVNDHGLDLPNFIETFISANDQSTARGMTLFASGNIIKLLEGDLSVVNDIFNKLSNTAKQFGSIELLRNPIAQQCLSETSIGYSSPEFKPNSNLSSKIALFKLSPDEVDKRIAESLGKVLMMQFASDYGQK